MPTLGGAAAGELPAGESDRCEVMELAISSVWLAIVAWLDLASFLRGTGGAAMALILALAASGAAVGLHIAATFYFRIPFWYGLLFPFGYTAGALMALDSVRRRLSGRVSWKGRIYS